MLGTIFYLKKLAMVATASNIKFAEKLQEKREIQAQANDELAESIKAALADAKIVISQNTTDEGTLYAAVSDEQIVDAIETFSGFRLENEQVVAENQVKEIGLHTISVVLGPDTQFETTLEVIPETK
jgi:large subunit ribosomal protein L9